MKNANVQSARWGYSLFALVLAAFSVLTAGAAMASAGAGTTPRQAAQLPGNYRVVAAPDAHVPRPIPDNGTVTSTITVTQVSTITSIDAISMTITHTFPADLDVFLISPAGTRVELFTDVCGGDDWTGANTNFRLSDGALDLVGEVCPPGSATYKPEGNLSDFRGEPSAGRWTLEITDDSPEDTGTLLDWNLAIPGAPPQPTRTPTVEPTLVPRPSPTPCGASFSDVGPNDFFAQGVRYLACKGAIGGYNDGTFRPYNATTRGQMAKIVVEGLDVPLFPPPATPSYSDVGRDNPFFIYIEAARTFGIATGYSDGTFRPFNNVTRGQLAKMVVNATGWDLINPQRPSFTDVLPSDTFYMEIETAVCYGVLGGYNDRTYRPNNNATRGQIAKMVYNADVNDVPCAAVPTPMARP